MFAIANSRAAKGLMALAAASLVFPARAVEGALCANAQETFREAQVRRQQRPQDAEAAWEFARAAFDLAEFATNRTERAGLAEQGIQASRQALARDTNSAAAHYYLSMNLGQLARTRGLSALILVDQMEGHFYAARKLDEHFDYAGPDRNLGLLYRDAPAIGSVGSRTRAKEHLERAVQLAPDYPENRLALVEGLLKWGNRDSAERELKAAEQIWPAARARLSGPAWTTNWTDWDGRLQKLKHRIEDPTKSLQTPRH